MRLPVMSGVVPPDGASTMTEKVASKILPSSMNFELPVVLPNTQVGLAVPAVAAASLNTICPPRTVFDGPAAHEVAS